MSDPVIELMHVDYRHPNGHLAIDDVSLTISRGERVAILGANGSGKSTLLLLLGGLLTPKRGKITYFGATDDPAIVRPRLGVLLQDPDDYLFHATVREDVAYGAEQLGDGDVSATVNELAQIFDISHLLDRAPFRLSGGEKKRAALASSLSHGPEVLLLDEPTSTLDVRYEQVVLDHLDCCERNAGATIVVGTPDVEIVPRLADRVILLSPGGAIAADGPPTSVLSNIDLLAENGLAPPSIVQLFTALGFDDPPVDVTGARERLSTQLHVSDR